jgi:nitroreductase
MTEAPNSARNVLKTRRTVHRFSPEPIPDGAVERAIEAAIAAPNHKLTNPWRFTRVGEATRQKITDRYVELKRQSKGALTDDQQAQYRNKVGDPPELVVPSQILTADDFQRREDYAACACAIQNLMLSLWSEGVRSKWTTGSITRDVETYNYLGIDKPDGSTPPSDGDEEILGFIWIGYPRDDRQGIQKPGRLDADEVTRHVE